MSEPLPPSQVLTALIAHINASGKPVHIGWDEVAQWHDEALPLFLGVGLLAKSNHTQSLECNGCEHRCFMPVEFTGDKQRAFIVCDHSEMQSHMGRIVVPLQRLKQWKTSPKHFAVVVAKLLGVENIANNKKDDAIYQLGMMKSDKGRRCVSLTVSPLSIVINQHAISLGDLLYIDNSELTIDHGRINELLNNPTRNAKNYTPNTDKQEDRKLATQAMYQDWNDAYIYSVKKHPKKSGEWHSQQIAKLPIAQGRDSETIRKNMK
ncbi:hypothetical protein IMCC1989_1358 [gamma proteobacterium IMCC1989]|nr:hypothetical protein IMCC1989_1358 [gamma proteobacterium IMCC1989]